MQQLDPGTDAEQVIYDQALSRVHELSDARRIRLLDAKEGIPAVLWAALVAGG